MRPRQFTRAAIERFARRAGVGLEVAPVAGKRADYLLTPPGETTAVRLRGAQLAAAWLAGYSAGRARQRALDRGRRKPFF